MNGAQAAPMNATEPHAQPVAWRTFARILRLRLRFVAVIAVTGLAFAYGDQLIGFVQKWARPSPARVAHATQFEYFCPMHPTVVRNEPAGCPSCGMPLARRVRGRMPETQAGGPARVQLSPERMVQAGIRTVEVEFAPMEE